jgi:hypothetical membrane protein
MTSRDFAYTALRLAAVYCFICFLSYFPTVFNAVNKLGEKTAALALVYNILVLLVGLLFWFKAKLLSAYFSLDKVSSQSKTEISDLYNLACIVIGIFLVLQYGSSLFSHIMYFLVSPTILGLAGKETDMTYVTIAIIADILKIVIGLMLIFKKEGFLNLIHNIRRK